ncbi:MAG TPA: DUF1684 domain-containing protein [Halococcus sp.]|nr:DUF1684 domain-containing protein [Halococcus sp.]
MADWEQKRNEQRAQKDEFFEEHPQSPIPRDERDDFSGLSYYPLDDSYRFEVELTPFDDHETLTVETTQDGTQRYYRWGKFHFELGGEEYALTAYKGDPTETRLWAPFRDETSGEETYGAGRYLDLDAEDRSDGTWQLDFNAAYNPFCAYNEHYECSLVPRENWLDVRIEAGEKSVQQ